MRFFCCRIVSLLQKSLIGNNMNPSKEDIMKMNKVLFVVISVVCALTFFSCDLLLKPLPLAVLDAYTPQAEDLSEVSASDLADAAADISLAADPEASKAVIEALGAKTDEEIRELEPEQKKAVLALTTSAILPVNTIVSTAYDIINRMNNNSGNDNRKALTNSREVESVPVDSSEDDVEALESELITIIKDVVGEINFVNTKATESILLELMEQYPGDDDTISIPDDEVPEVLLATISVAISACKSNLIDLDAISDLSEEYERFSDAIDELGQYFNPESESALTEEEAEEVAVTVLTALSVDEEVDPDGRRALKNALVIIDWLRQKEISIENIVDYFMAGN